MSDTLRDAEDELVAAIAGADDTPDASAVVETETPEAASDDAAPAEATSDTAADVPAAESVVPAAETAPPAPTTPAPAAEPFSVTVHGQSHAIPGTTYDKQANALRFADERAFQRAQNLLTKGREWETRGRQELHAVRRELETERTRKSDREVQAEAYLAEWQKLMTLPDDQFAAFAREARRQWATVEARAERAVAEAKLADVQRMQQPPEPDPETLLEQAQEGAAALVHHMVQDQPWADPTTQQALTQWMQSPSVLGQFVYRAPQDVPQHGIRQGQWVADWDRARALLVEYANPLAVAYQARQSAPSAPAVVAPPASVAPVAQQNARVLATTGRAKAAAPAPRTPNGSTPPASVDRRTARQQLNAELDAIARDVLRAS